MTRPDEAQPTPNADADELRRFDAMAQQWWDPDGSSKALHDLNPLRLAWIRDQAGGLHDRRVADIGCGGGLLAEALAREGAAVTAIDLAAEALAVARAHAAETDLAIDYREMDAEALAGEQPGSYDVVACMELLEHVPDPAAVVAAAGHLLRPGGVAVFSTLNRTPRAWLLAIAGAEYVLHLLPRGTHRYDRLIRPAELAALIRAAGLEAVATTGVAYNPLLRTCRLDPDPAVNYMMSARKPENDSA